MAVQDSLKKRYVYKLSTNLIGFGISVVTNAIIPRGLGPKNYGDFSFLTYFFTYLYSFFDMGTSTCYYTRLSQRQSDRGLLVFYFYFTSIIGLLSLLFVIISQIINLNQILWPNQGMFFVYLALCWGLIEWISRILNFTTDAFGLTVSSEKIKILQKVVGLILILLLFYAEILSLSNFFYYQFFNYLFIIIALILIIKKEGFLSDFSFSLNNKEKKQYSREFYNYSFPLFVYSLLGFVITFLDRWLLQIFGGSVQQGFYALSFQIGAICFLFTNAITPLLTREFSIAFKDNDLKKIESIYRRYVPMMYSIAAYFSCFIALQSEKITYIFGGSNFRGASLAITIMAFGPIHQTYGSITGSLFWASSQTKTYRNIGILFMIIGVPISYVFMAPEGSFGINGGAVGLAIKSIVLQVVYVNVLLYYNTKIIKITFWKYLIHQIISLISLLVIAFLAIYLCDNIFSLRESIVISFLLSGFMYSMMVAGFTYAQPILFGLTRQDIISVIKDGLIRLK